MHRDLQAPGQVGSEPLSRSARCTDQAIESEGQPDVDDDRFVLERQRSDACACVLVAP